MGVSKVRGRGRAGNAECYRECEAQSIADGRTLLLANVLHEHRICSLYMDMTTMTVYNCSSYQNIGAGDQRAGAAFAWIKS